MKYLQQLKDNLLETFSDTLTPENTHLFIVNGEMARNSGDINYIARFLFVDCRDNDPFSILTYIRHWFKSQSKPIPDLNFDSEIIDSETYDLSVDIGLMDKLITDEYGMAHICPPKVWSDDFDDFVSPGLIMPLFESPRP